MFTVTVMLDSVEKVQRFVSVISKYSCSFDIESEHSCVDAKSIVGLFSLDISKPLHLTIQDEGAELEVKDEEGKTIDKWISTKGDHIVNGLVEGKKYILTETICPYGYKQAESIIFEVTADKETQRIVMKDAPILKNIKIKKLDSETKEIIKDTFKFGIYSDENCTNLIKEVKSNKDEGIAQFNELRYGTYYIKETKAPKGYELSNRMAKVEINDKGIFVDGNQVEESNDTITFDFENKKIEVPKTGDNSHLRLALGIIILATLGIAYIFIHEHNK